MKTKLSATSAPWALALAVATGGSAMAADEQSTTVSGVQVTGRADSPLTSTSITGSRLALSALETPASIEVVSGDLIRERGDPSTQEAISRITGLTSVGTPGDGGGAVTARGFSGLGSVMQLYDGMRLYVAAGTITFPFDPWTVDRIEALRGPASVMFGEGAIGGAINVVPRHASAEQAFDYQVGYGSFNTRRIGLGAQGPLAESVSFRLDASYNASDNWVRRSDSKSMAISGEIRWQVTPAFALTLRDDYGSQRPMAYFGTPLIDHRLDTSIAKTNYNVLDSVLRYEDNWTQLKADWSPSANISVRNDLYYLRSDRHWRNAEVYVQNGPTTIDRTDNFIAIKHHQKQIGDRLEATLRSELGGLANRLAVGAEVNAIRFTHVNNGFADFGLPGNVVSIRDPNPGLFTQLSPPIKPAYDTDSDQFAVFGEDRIELNDRWSVVVGGRWDSFKFSRQPLPSGTPFGKTFKYGNARVGVVYQPSPTLSLYASYATGADPLGSLVTTSSSTVARDFDLSTARQAEVGLKQLFLNGRGEWTLAAYEITKKKLLASVPGQPGQTNLVGQRSSRGVEGTLTLAPTDAWRIEANVAFVDARFDDFLQGSIQRRGNTPAGVPATTANLWLTYRFLPQWTARAGARHVSKVYNDDANTLVVPSYTVTEAGVDWQVRENTTLTLRVSNLFDKAYAQATYADEQWILGRPRSVEVLLRGRF